MKPYLEKLPRDPGAAIAVLDRRLEDGIPFQWHHHPEYELTLTLNSAGERFIGDHVGTYGDGDLVLIGPNIPHTWSSRDRMNPAQPHHARVVWFSEGWATAMVAASPELKSVQSLLDRAGRALQFGPSAAAQSRGDIITLFDQPPAQRVLSVLRVLEQLAGDADSIPLSSVAPPRPTANATRERIDRILAHIHRAYDQPIRIADLADLAALSDSGLHRMFRLHTGTTVSDYVSRLRIGEACARLSATEEPIAHIADAVGYAALANFNRQFKTLRGMSPRDYRGNFQSRKRG